MCLDTDMVVTILLFLLLFCVIITGLFVLSVMGIVKLADARRKRLTTLSPSAADER
jgi:CBS domain containing-hemolysin-like protein